MAFATAFATGCKRTTGIDNGNVLQTPFSLYYSDTAGAVFNTNDGRNSNGVVFPPDGKSCRALTVSGYNILIAKNNLYYSNNNGKNFNVSYDTLSFFPYTNCEGMHLDMNQSMLLNIPSWGNRVYTMSNSPNSGSNWLGVAFSDQNGAFRSWNLDGGYDTTGTGILPVRMKSLTVLANGVLCGLAYSVPSASDTVHHRNFIREGKDDAVYTNKWREVTANPDGIAYIYMKNLAGTPLPPYGSTYTDTGSFTLGHLNNRLIAIDGSCHYGAWYSDDTGKNWQPYPGIPTGISLLCIESPWEEVCLVGTARHGLYMLNVHTGMWEQSNSGLGTNVTVRNIVGKENIYKNGTVRKFIYLATDQGIYESSDNGRNWTKTIPGNFVGVR